MDIHMYAIESLCCLVWLACDKMSSLISPCHVMHHELRLVVLLHSQLGTQLSFGALTKHLRMLRKLGCSSGSTMQRKTGRTEDVRYCSSSCASFCRACRGKFCHIYITSDWAKVGKNIILLAPEVRDINFWPVWHIRKQSWQWAVLISGVLVRNFIPSCQ